MILNCSNQSSRRKWLNSLYLDLNRRASFSSISLLRKCLMYQNFRIKRSYVKILIS
jgi:hypothetical protein